MKLHTVTLEEICPLQALYSPGHVPADTLCIIVCMKRCREKTQMMIRSERRVVGGLVRPVIGMEGGSSGCS